MHGRIGFFVAGRSFLYFGHAIFGFDFVAAVFAVDAAFGLFWRGHGGVHGYLSFGFDYFFHFCDQSFILFRR